ncbi:dihydropteroate synthase [Microbacterium sp.]|uniref:dihydropteroate synthase n=1 Tax=Microbacterium sp. TaxID=51671 RepID=UPI0039E2E587
MAVIMGVVNVTADSFSDGGRYLRHDAAIAHGLALRAAGAAIVDVGGESTRPGAERVPAAVEQERVLPVIEALVGAGAVVSVDTMNASTAVLAVAEGATIVNDVSGGLADPELVPAVAGTAADLVLGHWRGHSSDMYARARYDDIVAEVTGELTRRLQAATDAGIPPRRIVLDPGFGFGKEPADNWALARGLPRLVALGPRVLVGTSRKRMLATALGGAASEQRRDLATAVTSVLAAQSGVWGVRVHDVAGTRDALAVLAAWTGGSCSHAPD